MIKKFFAFVALLVSMDRCFFYALPTPEDYVNMGRKWLTFKNIPDGKVVQIDTLQEYQEFMQKREKLAVILFYDDRTSHSKQLFPLWEGLTTTLEGVAKVGAVSVSSSFGPVLANICKVHKVPSVYLIKISPSTEKSQNPIVINEYTDGISIEGVNKAVLTSLTNDYIDFPECSDDFHAIDERTTKSGKRFVVVLLTRKKRATDLFKTLSYKYSTEFSFVQVPYSVDLASELMEKHQLSKPKDWGPLLFLQDCRSTTPVKLYSEKKFDVSSLSLFLDQYLIGEYEAVDAENSAIMEMLSEVNLRCNSFSGIECSQLKDLLVSGRTIVIGILSDENLTKLYVMKNLACSYSTDISIQKIFWMSIGKATCLEKLLGIHLSEGFVLLSSSTSLFSYAKTTISQDCFVEFMDKKPNHPFSFDHSTF